jgi:hypothetical protein
MSEIRIGPWIQRLLLVAFVLLVGAAIATQLPELKRYLKVRQM